MTSSPHSATPAQRVEEPSELTSELARIYQTVYDIDLVYVKNCWKQCGDAHCCSFQRYKSRYRLLAQSGSQQLPLLPGEWRWLQQQGWAAQFEPCQFQVQTFQVDGHEFRYESVVSRRPGCACDHATRPTICRLYPLLPRFDLDGRLVGTESTGIYEEMERIGGLPAACKLEQLPFDQMTPFLSLCAALASSPLLRWHLEAYRLTKAHVAERLALRVQQTGKDVFGAFEAAYLRSTLIDGPELQSTLHDLAQAFDNRWPGWSRQAEGPGGS